MPTKILIVWWAVGNSLFFLFLEDNFINGQLFSYWHVYKDSIILNEYVVGNLFIMILYLVIHYFIH